jgi:hypothetical protein
MQHTEPHFVRRVQTAVVGEIGPIDRFHGMETLREILLVLHLLGFGALFGGLVVQAREAEKRVNGAMRDGVGTAVVAGLALVGVLEAGDSDVDHVKVGIKLVVGLVLLVLVMATMRKPTIPQGLWATMLALTVVNVGVAVLV